MLKQIANLEAVRSDFGDKVVNDKLAPLQKELQRCRMEIGELHVDGDFVAGDKRVEVTVNGVYEGRGPVPVERIPEVYAAIIAARCGRLPLGGVDLEASDPTSERAALTLEGVYIGLDTTRRVALTKEEVERRKEGDRVVLEKDRVVSALEAVADNRVLVLLGDPGSGKSTFLNRLALALVHQDAPEGWPAALDGLAPLPLVLRDFALWLDDRKGHPEASPNLLWRFVEHDLAARNAPFVADWLLGLLEEGRVLLLVDGLDEVPGAQAALVKATLLAFEERYARNRFLVSCRVLAFQQPQWALPKNRFPDFELAPFDDAKIRQFITHWYAEVARRWGIAAAQAERLADKLLHHALQRPELAGLAANPLLLTVMAVVHTHRNELPEERAPLYEEAVEVLLHHWERTKAQRHGGESRLLAQLAEGGVSRNDLRDLLEELAWTAHERGGGDEGVTGIPEAELRDGLARLHRGHDARLWAAAVVETLRLRAGLLLEREGGVFTFPHRSFQEYLAGLRLVRRGEFAREARALARQGAFWREVILWAVGALAHGQRQPEPALLLADGLCPADAADEDAAWRDAWLAGEVLLEVGRGRVARDYPARLKQVTHRLVALVEQGRLSPRERADAADVLGQLGDPRLGVTTLEVAGVTLPDIAWVTIPAGPFVMGSRDDDPEANDDEKGNPPALLMPYPYRISRYPVTVAQYAPFVDDNGYEKPRWWAWSELAEGWRRNNRRKAPNGWGQQTVHPNRPVVDVTWFEANAFAHWLTERLHTTGLLFDGEVVRLPSEAEWECAARGSRARRYPWGGEAWDPLRANIDQSELDRPTAVGTFPLGGTPDEEAGALHDLAGNVWEWCRTRYQPYPYTPSKGGCNNPVGREDLVLRGGSWIDDEKYVRCSSRIGFQPDVEFIDFGFRMVVSPTDSVY